MRIVIVDSNILLLPAQFKIDVFSELDRLLAGESEAVEFQVASQTVGELSTLASNPNRPVSVAHARLAGAIIRHAIDKGKVKEVKMSGRVDDWLLAYAIKKHAIVATNDLGLRARLRKQHVRLIGMKGKSHLDWI